MASEYGWAKTEIFEQVYLDELYYLVQQINKRRTNEYKMQLAIAQNPHVKNPKTLWEILKQQDEYEPKAKTLDVLGFELLKQKMSANPRIIVKP